MDKYQTRDFIATRVAKEFKDGDVVNLGIGLPTLVANFLPSGISINLQSENGLIGLGPKPTEVNFDKDITNAGGQPVTLLEGGMYFDSTLSFSIIRGGHVDVTVLGSLQVDESGSLANWIIPGKMVPGMGGAMDLVTGAKTLFMADTKPYTEYSFGLDNIGFGKWRFLRIDYVRSNFGGIKNDGLLFRLSLFN